MSGVKCSWRKWGIYVFDKEIVRFDSCCQKCPLVPSLPKPAVSMSTPSTSPSVRDSKFFILFMALLLCFASEYSVEGAKVTVLGCLAWTK